MDAVQHFAWLSAPATFDPVAHAVFDEPWRSLTIQGQEGQSTVCQVEIKHPGQGLLAAGRDLYAQISETRDGTTHQLFAGRVIGAPNGLAGDFMTISLDSRFGNLDAAIATALAPYKVSPGYDPLFIDPANVDLPEEILEGYHAFLFVDPRTQEVRVSDALVGSAVSTTSLTPASSALTFDFPDGLPFAPGVRVRVWWRGDFREHFTGPITVYGSGSMTVAADTHNGSTARDDWVISLDLPASAIEGESVNMTVATKPFTAVSTSIEAQWTQTFSADVDLTPAILTAAGRPTIRTLCVDEDFAAAWPQAGSDVNGNSGYTVKTSSLVKQPGNATVSVLVGFASFEFMPIRTYTPALTVTAGLQQKRVETATFVLSSNAQAVMANLSQADPLVYRLNDVGSELTTPGHGVFFQTDRGLQALSHAMQRTRVALAESQRCVEVPVHVPGWPLEVVYLTTDHTVCVHSPKLPGGIAIGKVSQFSKAMTENERSCDLTLKCSIGKGYNLADGTSDNDYVADDYIAEGYFMSTGAVLNTGGPTPIAFNSFGDQGPTDALVNIPTWTAADFVTSITVGPQYEAQLTYLQAHQYLAPSAYRDGTSPSTPDDTVSNNQKTVLQISLASLATVDEISTAYTVTTVGAYGLPATIDMEAP